MYNYDPKSLKAEEFINHEEIEETLRYAEENKHNAALIDSILEKAKLRNSHIGFVMQDFALVEKYTVKQNINIPLIYTDKPINKEKAINDVLKSVGLSDKTNTPAYRLSGGQKQRVAIARALASEAPIILADEPTGNLDSDTAGEIIEILKRLAKERYKCVIVVSHSK